MSAYRPFLLPLLHAGTLKKRGAAPSNPLEEEALYNSLDPQERPDWPTLGEKVRSSCGLPMLVSQIEGSEVDFPPASIGGRSPDRFLLLRNGSMEWFVIEHPAGLAQFDNHGLPHQRVAIARPSLFARWASGAQETAADREQSGQASGAQADTSMESFHRFVRELLHEQRPSDWHLEPVRQGFRSRLRIDGRLTEPQLLSQRKGAWLINSAMTKAGLGPPGRGSAIDSGFTLKDESGETCSVRLSLVPGLHGHALVARFLYPGRVFGLQHLGIPAQTTEQLVRLYQDRDGLWLVAGPTGSGKSTTLHALVRLSIAGSEKILAAEDPVEEIIPGVQQVQIDKPPGLTFARALRAFMRQSPDCLLVGEIRDIETAAIALQAARTGHRVLSSIHARDTPGVIRRFEDLQQPRRQVLQVCRALIHQRLIPLLCRECHKEVRLEDGFQQLALDLGLEPPRSCFTAAGCGSCSNGYRGRTGIFSLESCAGSEPAPHPLLLPAWQLLCSGKTAPAAVLPFFPPAMRANFTVCQV
jgi:type II secretory ATPase GspE/PulE/Tfp pilus assembly ATPase PilB-like protein